MTTPDQPWARRPAIPGLRALVTTVHAGNLALHAGADPGGARAARARLEERIGRRVLFVSQIHSPRVVRIDRTTDLDAFAADPPECDALVTARDDVALAVMVADCMPIAFADPDVGVVGAAHAGRRGLLDGVIQNTVAAMTDLGARPERIRASVGPSICGRCYEVPADMLEEAVRSNPAAGGETRWGTPAVDLQSGARWALEQAGIRDEHMELPTVCTLEDEDFFSHRRSSASGRFATVVWRDGSAENPDSARHAAQR
ncbi:peptidoglycan editing factor PgeF [Helcobacillus massiliensis]|uniref:peptidoglycan editing factor PgeF n=1 Tax=Helcobacillus massiliensis TaxID=521392 RepID=UPI0021A411E8|nr:peptidoglycan editing factor PgeF [Helcobacillus massiliensis]MCT1557829.1 peptidoglycan editing factor PgeF [Helcobacillus massiliensis]MCT2036675.1 peptidoglycan editing factor PgeF [Helcobacillus massiliensis]MCT2332146.1 peptidoglycan editing factor PgeF [Helcobacillus massiliensis]